MIALKVSVEVEIFQELLYDSKVNDFNRMCPFITIQGELRSTAIDMNIWLDTDLDYGLVQNIDYIL